MKKPQPNRGRTTSVNDHYQKQTTTYMKELKEVSKSVDISQQKNLKVNQSQTIEPKTGKIRPFGLRNQVILKPIKQLTKFQHKNEQMKLNEDKEKSKTDNESVQKYYSQTLEISQKKLAILPPLTPKIHHKKKEKQLDYLLKYSMRSKKGTSDSKKFNQDIFVSSLNCGSNKDLHAFAVGDGHGQVGHYVSGFLKEQFKEKINVNLSKQHQDFTISEIWVEQLYKELSTGLMENVQIDSMYSGSTLVSVFIQNSKLVCGNVGDSRAIIGKQLDSGDWVVEVLTKDHKPGDKEEADRIKLNKGRIAPYKSADGRLEGPLRIWLPYEQIPGLAMTRSFGDHIATSIGLISEPQMKTITLQQTHKIIVLGSDGLWDFVKNQEVIELLARYYLKGDLDLACKELFGFVINRWQERLDSIDDITFAILFIYYQ